MKKIFLICLLFGCLSRQVSARDDSAENSFTGLELPVAKSEDCDWVFDQLEVTQAWDLLRRKGFTRPGENVTMAHLDTGVIPLQSLLYTYKASNGESGLQLSGGGSASLQLNLVQNQKLAWDNDPKALSFGHGTSTASLMIGWSSQGEISPSGFRGLAPWLRFIPIKVTDSVLMVGNMSTGGSADLKNLAAGIRLAAQLRAEIISISLGALFDNEGLIKTAVREALDGGAIIVAAAGQTFPVNMIPLPARLSGVIAVTASAKDKTPWRDAFVGRHIAWSAPGAGICHIKANPVNNSADPIALGNPIIALTGRRGENLRFSESLVSSSGTSYSTAYTAAAAALWLQFHSSSKLRALYGARNISALFAAVAKRHAMERPADWKSEKHGQGILNIRKLIEAPLPCSSEDTRETCEVKLSRFLSFTP